MFLEVIFKRIIAVARGKSLRRSTKMQRNRIRKPPSSMETGIKIVVGAKIFCSYASGRCVHIAKITMSE